MANRHRSKHNRSKRNITKLFEERRGNLDSRVKRDYIRNGIATIPCNISDYNDVISTYSVDGFETLAPEFEDYVKSSAEVATPEHPLVLNIIGDSLSEKEKKTIADVIMEDFAYDLGIVEKEEKRHMRIFLGMFFGLLISGVLLYLTHVLAEVPRELFFILFWFMGDTLCDYIFLTGHDLRRDRLLAGRLASIRVMFSDSFKDPAYTKNDVDRLYSEIEKEVEETIREEKSAETDDSIV
ncbi:MAG TPA: hypothetical protein DCL38_04870 [Lachnospiraceae bacterium]|nr:hypothetical protein [Lachnospiraceae bacterium]